MKRTLKLLQRINANLNTFRLASIIILVVGLIFISSSKEAQAIDSNCSIPNNIECEVSDPDGFTDVRVNVDFGGEIGSIDVVNQESSTCRTKTKVSWDPIVPNFEIFATPCGGGGKLVSKVSDKLVSKQTIQGVQGKKFVKYQ